MSLPTSKSFLSPQPLNMYLDGRWVQAAGAATFATLNPGTGRELARVPAGEKADIDRALDAAERAFDRSGWATMPATNRAVILHRLADLITKHQDTIAEIESLDVGKPVAQARGFDVPFAAQAFRYYADLSVQVRRREPIAVSGFEAHSALKPFGVCGFIFPWNFPFLLVGWGTAPALAAGNTVVIKPAEDTPLSTLYFARLAEEAGVPPGVVNVVTGFGETAGKSLAESPRIKRMSFTGSPEVGRQIAAACGRNLVPTKLELGGKGAAVIFADTPVKEVARSLAAAVTLNAGQVCCTATRWVVHRSVHDDFVAQAVAALQEFKIGYGGAPDTNIGPVVSEKQRTRVLGYLEKGVAEGATTLLPGGAVTVQGYEQGFYVRPALLGGAPDNVCAREEIFGPVAYVMPFDDDDEAVALVNRSSYGLANSVWSADAEKAKSVAERLVAANGWINAHNLFAYGIPYGGCNLSGCGGGVLGPDTLWDYFRKQSIVRPLN